MNTLENRNERTGKLLRNVLLGGVSALTVGVFAAPALAQDASSSTAASPDVETVTVTGILGSLQRDLDIKRDSLGLVDAISSEDIGKFPDSELAASMQRIPGVTISRGVSALSGTGSTSSVGDATEITVRGFGPTFNETLYDGRQVSSAIGNRGFDYSAVSADFVSEIDILKSPDSTLSAGAIGATVNIKYPKPFDHPGLKLVGSLSATYEPNQGTPTPNGDILFSDTFDNDTFGILVDASYQDSKTLNNHINIQAWNGQQVAASQLKGAAPGASTTPNINAFAIQDYGIYQEHTHEMRETGRLVLQWRPADNLELTFNDDYSRDTVHENQYGYSVWFNTGSLQNVVQNSHGTIISADQPNTPTDFQGQINGSVIENNEAGFNAKLDVNSKFSVIADADFAESWLNPGGQLTSIDSDVGYGPSQGGGTNGTDVGIAGVGKGQLPYPTSVGPGGNSADFLGTGIIGSHVFPMGSTRNYDAVSQGKLEADWTEENFQLKIGVDYMADHENLDEFDDFQNNDWQAYAGYGPASNNYYPVSQPGVFVPSPGHLTALPGDPGYMDPNCPLGVNGGNPCPAGATLPQNLFTNSFSTANFISGFGNSNALPTRVLQFNPGPVLAYLQSLGNPQTSYVPGANKTCCSPAFNGTYQIVQSAGAFQQVYEDTTAAYITMNDKVMIGGLPLKINIGIRDEETAVRSNGLAVSPVNFAVQPSDHTAFLVTKSAVPVAVSGSNRYTNLLPNFDLNLALTDDLQLRFDASRTLTKPPLGDLTPDTNLVSTRVGDVTATGGNPQLLPFISDNLDLGAEYYYAPNSYFSIDGFNKNISNFITQGASQHTFAGIIDPTTGSPVQYTLTGNANNANAKVNGLEVALQNVFGDSGWGFQANATVVETDHPYDPSNLTVGAFAITGIGNSANLMGFYDKDGFQARVAVNWRAGYLDHFGQIQNGSIFGTEPTFVNGTTQVDFSTSYDLTDNLNIYFEGINLNDATYSTHGRYAEQLLDANDYGRTFRIGLHWKL